MKKLFALLLAMAMALNIGTMALAETQAAPTDAQATAQQGETLPQAPPEGQAPESYAAATEFTQDNETTGQTYASTGVDENAIHIHGGAQVALHSPIITRINGQSAGGDASSFYGVGAALLTTDGTVYLTGGTIETDAAGGAGVFAYGNGTAYLADTSIATAQNTSGGVHVAGGGKLYAWNLNVGTSGESSAAIRSDRGGGTMVVDGGMYYTSGTGSPAVYCTADISVANATLTAENSEAICIEGINSVRLFDCSITGNMQDLEQNDCTWTAIIYQSMSGDAEIGNSTFQLVGGSLTSKNGGLLYTTNTECSLLLSGVEITYSEDSEFFLRCTGNNNARGWGQAGANGSDCTFTADSQPMQGDVIWDSISNLDFYMVNGSSLTGAVVQDEQFAGQGGDGTCSLYIDASSAWTVTGDSRLTHLNCAGAIADDKGLSVSVVGTDGTEYVTGESEYTVTVDSYATTADVSGAAAVPAWSDYAVEKPAQLQGAEEVNTLSNQ